MPAGIQIFNSSGTVQIDDSDPALALREKRTVSVPFNTSTAVTFSNVEFPMLAVSTGVTSSYISVYRAVRSGSSITYYLRQTGDNALSVTCYFFDRPVPTTSNFGLRIFDPSGKCTFDSNHKHGVIRQDLTINTGDQGHSVTVSKPSNRTWSVVFLRTSYGYELRDGGQIADNEWWWEEYWYQSGVSYTSSTEIRATRWAFRESILRTDNYQAPETTTMDGEAKFLFLDVSGY